MYFLFSVLEGSVAECGRIVAFAASKHRIYIACKTQMICYLYLFQMKCTSVSLSSSSYIRELSLDGFKQTGLSSLKCNEILLYFDIFSTADNICKT